jgi:hypothetical protein
MDYRRGIIVSRFAWENKAMAHISPRVSQPAQPRAQRRARPHSPLRAPFLLFLGLTAIAGGYIGYVLWPNWPGAPVSLEAPALPIVVAGEMFNIEPAAIRQSVQRRPGSQQRVDLAYLWPSLTPPDPALAADAANPADPNQRLFVTIDDGRDELSPVERVKTIYPRYFAAAATAQPDGLTLRAFRDGTPYQGEDLIYQESDADDFTARCSRSGIGNSGMCLLQRRIGHADVTVRFPRDWLADWKKVLYGIDRVIARLHPEVK